MAESMKTPEDKNVPVHVSVQRVEEMFDRGRQLLRDIHEMPNRAEQKIVIQGIWVMFTEATE